MGFSLPYFSRVFLFFIYVLDVLPVPFRPGLGWMAGVPGLEQSWMQCQSFPKSWLSDELVSWQQQEIPPKGKPESLLLWLSVDGWWGNVIADGNLGGWRDNSDFTPRRGLGVNLELQPLAILGLETSPLLVIIFHYLMISFFLQPRFNWDEQQFPKALWISQIPPALPTWSDFCKGILKSKTSPWPMKQMKAVWTVTSWS